MPTLVTIKETDNFKVKCYKVSKRLVLRIEEESDGMLYFVTIQDKKRDNYVQIPSGLPEVAQILKELKELI